MIPDFTFDRPFQYYASRARCTCRAAGNTLGHHHAPSCAVGVLYTAWLQAGQDFYRERLSHVPSRLPYHGTDSIE